MHTSEDLQSVLFLDIETVPAYRKLNEVPQVLRELWIEQNTKKHKKASEGEDQESDEASYGSAGLRAEFGKVICISLGRFDGGVEESNFKTHTGSVKRFLEIKWATVRLDQRVYKNF